MAEYDDMFISLREHKYYNAYNVDIAFQQLGGTLKTTSSSASLGRGYNFICFPAWYIHNKYIKFKIRCEWSGAPSASVIWRAFIMDGTYDRTSNVDFPTGSAILSKGAGELQAIWSKTGAAFDTTVTVGPIQIDVSSALLDEVTIFFQIHDCWSGQFVASHIDYIQICNSDASIIYWEQNCNGAVTMEQVTSQGDYGYMGSLNPCGTLIQPCEDIYNQVDCEANDCCWCEVDGIWQCVDCPCPPLWKHDEVGLKGVEDCIIDYVLSWDEEEGIPTPIKRLIRKESPTTQAEYSTRLPRIIELEGKVTKTHRNCLEDLKHTHQWLRLYDDYESLIDSVWLEYLSSRWAGDEDHHYPWHIRMTLICSTT